MQGTLFVKVSPLHAALFSLVLGTASTALLYTLVNPLTASLSLANLILYTAVYTPLKRVSWVYNDNDYR